MLAPSSPYQSVRSASRMAPSASQELDRKHARKQAAQLTTMA